MNVHFELWTLRTIRTTYDYVTFSGWWMIGIAINYVEKNVANFQ